MIEQLACGYVGLEHGFLTRQGELLCPERGRELRGIGVGSMRVADVQRCEKCGEIFSVQSTTHECLKCGYENEEVELKPKEVYVRLNTREHREGGPGSEAPRCH